MPGSNHGEGRASRHDPRARRPAAIRVIGCRAGWLDGSALLGGDVRLRYFRSDRRLPPWSIDSQMTRYVGVSIVLLFALAASQNLARAQGNELHIELNRLEEHGDGCRVHLVLENTSPRAYTSYRLDLVIFAADGVISRRLALETAPLRANKTMVKEFELADLTCREVGRILLNDVAACSSDSGDRDDCVTTTRVSSRASVAFVK